MKKKVLLVDDEIEMTDLMKNFLEEENYEVCVANDGGEGLTALRDSRPDLIVLDINMPGMGGLSFLSRLNQMVDGDIPVLVTTGQTYMSQIFSNQNRIGGFLSKPFQLPELLNRIQNILR